MKSSSSSPRRRRRRASRAPARLIVGGRSPPGVVETVARLTSTTVLGLRYRPPAGTSSDGRDDSLRASTETATSVFPSVHVGLPNCLISGAQAVTSPAEEPARL